MFMVKIAIVGTGYVGLVSGTCLAEIGHEVICSDVLEEKINMLKNGKIPIYEVGLKELVDKNVKEGRLSFTTDVGSAIKESLVIFSAVGTPPDENHRADLKFVKQVAKTFSKNLNSYKIFVNKSTVPVGTGDMTRNIIEIESGKKEINGDFDVVSNPEFLREGAAVKDFLNPDRIVVGVSSEKAKTIMKRVYSPFERMQSPIIFTDVKSSELIKYAANSFLATKISFINEISKYCDLVGADVKEVSKGMGSDKRIGPRFLQAGLGWGGSCFPKDVDALFESGEDVGYKFEIIDAARKVNRKQKIIPYEKVRQELGSLKNKIITIWGLSFKPRTDDVREAPAKEVIELALKDGAIINVFDPIAIDNFKIWYPNLNVNYFEDAYDALNNSDALVIITEWDEFRILDFDKLKKLMKNKLIIDGRNIYDPIEMKTEGIKYIGIGRK